MVASHCRPSSAWVAVALLATAVFLAACSSAAQPCAYRSVWGQSFSVTYPKDASGADCKKIELSCSNVEFMWPSSRSASSSSMVFYLETDKQWSPRKLSIQPDADGTLPVSVTSNNAHMVQVVRSTSVVVDFTSFLFSDTDAARLDYSPKVTVHCLEASFEAIQPTEHVTSTSQSPFTLATVGAGEATPITCENDFYNPRITGVSGFSTQGVNYYEQSRTTTATAVSTLPRTFTDYVIVENSNAIGSLTVSGFCYYNGALAEVVAKAIGMALMTLVLIIVGSICGCCCLVGVCCYFACRKPKQNVYVVNQQPHTEEGYLQRGSHTPLV